MRIRLKKLASYILPLLLIGAMILAYPVSADINVPYQIDSNYVVTLKNVVYDAGDNEQTWYYEVECTGSPAISHFLFEFKEICDPPLDAIVDAGPGTVEISEDYDDTIPPMDKIGIKFETPVLEGEKVQVWFTLKGQWDDGTIEFWIKAGETTPHGTVEGPECKELCNVYISTFPSSTSWIKVEGPGLPPGGIIVDDYNPNQELLYGETYKVTSHVPNGYLFLYWDAGGNIDLSSTSTNPTWMTVLCGGSLAAYIHRIEHDVAAISQTAFETTVEPGTLVEISVTVANYGEVPESFDVTCYYDDEEIDTIRVYDLASGDTETVKFTWDTGGVPLNTYLIKAWADSGEEIEEIESEDNNWCMMELPIFVIPEQPFGTITALISTIAALILFSAKRPSIKI
jgi:hypothetical protein